MQTFFADLWELDANREELSKVWGPKSTKKNQMRRIEAILQHIEPPFIRDIALADIAKSGNDTVPTNEELYTIVFNLFSQLQPLFLYAQNKKYEDVIPLTKKAAARLRKANPKKQHTSAYRNLQSNTNNADSGTVKTRDKGKCLFCTKIGHKKSNCFINPDNPNNRLQEFEKKRQLRKERETKKETQNNKWKLGYVSDSSVNQPIRKKEWEICLDSKVIPHTTVHLDTGSDITLITESELYSIALRCLISNTRD